MKTTSSYAVAPTRATVSTPVSPGPTTFVCPSCAGQVQLLVEGSDLCLRCDHLHFPDPLLGGPL